MRAFGLIALPLLGGCGGAAGLGGSGLQQAGRNFPPMIIGANTDAVPGLVAVRPCPAPGGRVEQKGGPAFNYLRASPADPDLSIAAAISSCRMPAFSARGPRNQASGAPSPPPSSVSGACNARSHARARPLNHASDRR